jgi:hypothetical protein
VAVKKSAGRSMQRESVQVDYRTVKSEIEKKWPEWKKNAYNANFATSNHSEKLIVK